MSDPRIPEARAYLHEACSSETIVSGEAFEVLSDPLSDIERTWCETCVDYYPLSDFAWSDTGERITDYYARHSAGATELQRFLCSRLCLLITVTIGLLLGIILAYIGFRDDGFQALLLTAFTLGVIGAIVFGSIKEFVIAPAIVRKVCGVNDTRMLK